MSESRKDDAATEINKSEHLQLAAEAMRLERANKSLSSETARLSEQIAALRNDLLRWEEEEASVCPEDVDFTDYIKLLDANIFAKDFALAELQRENGRLRELATWKPITPDSLPKIGDEVLFMSGTYSQLEVVRDDSAARPGRKWIARRYSHHRPINPPPAKEQS